MFLAIDIGNSKIKCGLFDRDDLVLTVEMKSDPTASVAAYRHSLRSRLGDLTPTEAGISSVVPTLTEKIVKAVRDDFMVPVSVVGPNHDPPFEVDYVPAESLGADRLCAAVAAFMRYARKDHGGDDHTHIDHVQNDPAPDDNGPARPLVVVDAGTTVTYEVVVDGVYKGGAIAPGPALSAAALSGRTGKLPAVETSIPKHAVGNSTDDGIRSGIMFGFVDSVTGMIDRITADLGMTPFVVATGGGGAFLKKHVDSVDVYEPHLVLEGIAFMIRRTESD